MDWGSLGQAAALFIIDYVAVVFGVVTGAMHAFDRKLDIIGAVALGLITGYGGGIMRDILLQDQGFFFMEHPNLVVVSACVCAVAFYVRKKLARFEVALYYIDAFSLGLFAMAGASKALSADTGLVLAVILGLLTAVGGGALRDICMGEVPAVFRAGNFYAVSALAGAVSFVTVIAVGMRIAVAAMVCIVVTFLLTVLSKRFGWRTHPGGES